MVMSLGLGLGLPFTGNTSSAALLNPFFMDAGTPRGWGGKQPAVAEAPGTTFGGTYGGSFGVDALGRIVPAVAGVIGYVTTGADWTAAPPVGTHRIVSNGTGLSYDVTTRAGSLHIQGDDIYYGFTNRADRFARGVTAWARDIVYGTGEVNDITPPALAAYGGGATRFTMRSETVDTSLDADGIPQRQHGLVFGEINFGPADLANYPIDFVDTNFYTNFNGTPASDRIFAAGSGGGGGGVGFYNCNFENGPLVQPGTGAYSGMRGGAVVRGATTFQTCRFKNLGTFCIQLNTLVLTGPAVVKNCDLIYAQSDGIDFAGSFITFLGNFYSMAATAVGEHADPFQFQGGSATVGDWTFQKNFAGNDINGRMNSMHYLSDLSAGFMQNVLIENDCSYFSGQHGVTMQKPDAPVIRYCNLLYDPNTPNVSLSNNGVIFQSTGQNGSTINYSIVNAISLGGQPGVNTQTGNLVIDISAMSIAQINTRYAQIFPNLPANLTDARWKTYAGWLNIWTPSDTAMASGGAKNVDGRFAGMLFPATAGNTVGAWNDGTVFSPLDPTWVAAHPPATRPA